MIGTPEPGQAPRKRDMAAGRMLPGSKKLILDPQRECAPPGRLGPCAIIMAPGVIITVSLAMPAQSVRACSLRSNMRDILLWFTIKRFQRTVP